MSKSEGRQVTRDGMEGMSGRLDSWKEIAAYLRHDVRTVQRWERNAELPVHRRPTLRRAMVFAYKSELDDWWSDAERRLAQGGTRGRRDGNPRLAVAAAVFLSAVAVLAAAVYKAEVKRPPANNGFLTYERSDVLRSDAAAVSPDGKWLAFRDQPSAHLWLRERHGGALRRLVAEPVHADIAWSPDGEQVAFVSVGRKARLEVVSVANGEREILIESDSLGMVPRPLDWAEDGRRILCAAYCRQGRLSLVSVEDGSASEIAVRMGPMRHVRLSPDGGSIVYSARDGAGGMEVFVRPTRGGAEIRLTGGGGASTAPAWSADGRRVFFVRTFGTNFDLWSQQVNPRSGTTEGDPLRLGVVGGEGSVRQLLVRGDELLLVRRGSPADVRVCLLPAITGTNSARDFRDGTSVRYWTSNDNRLRYADHARDGGSPSLGLMERNIRTGEDRVIQMPRWKFPAPQFISNYRPANHRWSAVLSRDEAGRRTIWRLDTETGETAPVAHTEPHMLAPQWSRDGTKLLTTTYVSKRKKYRIDAARLPRREFETLFWSWRRPRQLTWSNDGTEIAYIDGQCLRVMSSDGTRSDMLSCAPAGLEGADEGAGQGLLGWSPDGRKLAWSVRVPRDGRQELWIVDRDGGDHTVAWTGKSDYQTRAVNPQWSPDGQWIAFDVRTRSLTEVWELRNFLRAGGEQEPPA